MVTNKVKEELLREHMGDEFTDALFVDAKKKQDVLNTLGVESKEAGDEEEAPSEDAEEAPEADALKPKAKAKKAEEPALNEQMSALIKGIAKELEFDELSEYFEGMEKKVILLEAQVKALSKDEDEKLAKRISPDASKHHYAWSKRKSQDKKTVINEDDADDETKELLDAQPEATFIKMASLGAEAEVK